MDKVRCPACAVQVLPMADHRCPNCGRTIPEDSGESPVVESGDLPRLPEKTAARTLMQVFGVMAAVSAVLGLGAIWSLSMRLVTEYHWVWTIMLGVAGFTSMICWVSCVICLIGYLMQRRQKQS